MPVVTTGTRQAIASASTLGKPSRSPSSSTRHGRQTHRCATVLCQQLGLPHRAGEPDAIVETERGDQAPQLVAVLAVFTHDQRLERTPRSLEASRRP